MLYTSFIRLNKCYRKVPNVNNLKAKMHQEQNTEESEDDEKPNTHLGMLRACVFLEKMHRHINAVKIIR